MPKNKKKLSLKRITVIALVALTAGIAAFLLISNHMLSNAVPRAKLLGFAPANQPGKAEIDPQLETHTCGLHSLCSIYKAYGLDPDEHALRKRLGVDTPAVPTKADTQGTLQPDIARVLAQDGFLVRLLELDANHPTTSLASHLASGQLALALIRKPDNGNLH